MAEQQPPPPPGGSGDSDEPTDRDRDLLRRLFKWNPNLIEQEAPEFMAWLVSRLEVSNIQIPISQIPGYSQVKPQTATVATQETTTSDTYDDLTTPGPSLTGIPAGTYLIIYGAGLRNTTANKTAQMILSVNGTETGDPVQGGASSEFFTVGRAHTVTLTADDNTIATKYRRGSSGGTAEFYGRYLTALRTANP